MPTGKSHPSHWTITGVIAASLLIQWHSAVPAEPVTPSAFYQEVFSYSSILIPTADEFRQWLSANHPELQGPTLVRHEAKPDPDIPVSLQTQPDARHETPAINPSPTGNIPREILSENYRLEPGDGVTITLNNLKELEIHIPALETSGKAVLKLIGEIVLAGRTEAELLDELTRRYKTYLWDPRPDIAFHPVPKPGPQVLGAIQRAGLITLSKEAPLTLEKVVSQAGGLCPDADIRHFFIINPNRRTVREIDLQSFLASGEPNALPITLDDRDIVFIPRLNGEHLDPQTLRLVGQSNYAPPTYGVRIVGEVPKPDYYQLPPRQMTLQTALAKAGLSTRDKRTIEILRPDGNGRLERLAVRSGEQEIFLLPEDIVEVRP